MARGKQALEAARRRSEAAHEHIDRLTDQVTELKIRTRRVEADAAAMPGWRSRARELERQLAEVDGPYKQRYEAESARRHELRQQIEEERRRLRTLTVRWLNLLHGDVVFSPEEWQEMAGLLGYSSVRELINDGLPVANDGNPYRHSSTLVAGIANALESDRELTESERKRALLLYGHLVEFLRDETEENRHSLWAAIAVFVDPHENELDRLDALGEAIDIRNRFGTTARRLHPGNRALEPGTS